MQNGLRFVPEHFCKYLLDFLIISSLFYERAVRFYGPLRLHVTTLIPDGADLFDGAVDRGDRVGGAFLFEPPLNHISQTARTELEISMHPILASRLIEYLEFVLTEIARPHGSVLSAAFAVSVRDDVDKAIARLISARMRPAI